MEYVILQPFTMLMFEKFLWQTETSHWTCVQARSQTNNLGGLKLSAGI